MSKQRIIIREREREIGREIIEIDGERVRLKKEI